MIVPRKEGTKRTRRKFVFIDNSDAEEQNGDSASSGRSASGVRWKAAVAEEKRREGKVVPNAVKKRVSEVNGFLREQDIHELRMQTKYTERELFVLFNRFKALTSLSSDPSGIDKETFKKGVPMLSVEDDFFVDHVFEVLDEDASGMIDWNEFLEALSSLNRGSREKRAEFLFRVYNLSKDRQKGITREFLRQFFLESLLVDVNESVLSVTETFIDQVFQDVAADKNGMITLDKLLDYIKRQPDEEDIFGLFGRSMTNRVT